MKFSAVLALIAAPLLALAQENPFNIPTTGLATEAGATVTLSWDPTTTGTISLILRNGAASTLNTGEFIAQNIPNSGSFTWSVPTDIIRGSDYAIEIRPTGGSASDSNFTPQFIIESTNNAVRTSTTTGASATSTGTTLATSTGTTLTTSTGTSTGTTVSTSTGTSTTSTGTATTTGTSTATSASQTTHTSTTSRTSSSGTSSGASAPSATGAAPRASAAAGMMGLIALGALAL